MDKVRGAVCLAIVLACAGLQGPPAAGQIVFEPPVGHAAEVSVIGGEAVATGDLDGDGHLDVVVSEPFQGRIQVLLNAGDGSLAAPAEVLLAVAGADELTLVDLDGDGPLDLVAQADGDVVVALGHGDGTFDDPAIHSIHPWTVGLAVGELTGDGTPDIVGVASNWMSGGAAVYLLPGAGDGSFEAAQFLFSTTASGYALGLPAVGDLDGDGLDDVAVVRGSLFDGDDVSLHLSGSEPSFATSWYAMPHKVFRLALEDVDGDGALDLLALHEEQDVSGISVALGNGAGAFGPSAFFATGSQPRDLVVEDFDGDGVLDVATANLDGGDATVLRGAGDGSFAPAVTVSGLPGAVGLVAGEMDGAGYADLVVVRGVTSDPVAVVLNHTYGPSAPFCDLGQAVAGEVGFPIQLAEGSLVPGERFTLRLAAAAPETVAWLVLGWAAIDMPFKGGTLVPRPDLVFGPMPLAGATALHLTTTWPDIPAGLSLWTQFWLEDVGGPHGFASTSAVVGVTP